MFDQLASLPEGLQGSPYLLEGQQRRFAKGAYLYQPADRMETVFIVTSGMVKIGGYSPEGCEVIYDLARPGDFCGNLKYLGGGKFQEFARAITDIEAITYDLQAFKSAFRDDKRLHDWFVRLMVLRWSRSETRLFRIASLKPQPRVAALLEELQTDAREILQLLNQADLANLTGLSRQTISKVLSTMSRR